MLGKHKCFRKPLNTERDENWRKLSGNLFQIGGAALAKFLSLKPFIPVNVTTSVHVSSERREHVMNGYWYLWNKMEQDMESKTHDFPANTTHVYNIFTMLGQRRNVGPTLYNQMC